MTDRAEAGIATGIGTIITERRKSVVTRPRIGATQGFGIAGVRSVAQALPRSREQFARQ
jgi:hypothetical protein